MSVARLVGLDGRGGAEHSRHVKTSFAGNGTAVVFDWRVRTTRRWMSALGVIARPALVWNHDRVMAAGGVGLARELGVQLLASSRT